MPDWELAAQTAAVKILKYSPASMKECNFFISDIASFLKRGNSMSEIVERSFLNVIGSTAGAQYRSSINSQNSSYESTSVLIASELLKKHLDYGVHNILRFGTLGIWVRISDKFARWENLTSRDSAAQNEPLVDTYKDIFGYCIIGTMLLDDTFESPVRAHGYSTEDQIREDHGFGRRKSGVHKI